MLGSLGPWFASVTRPLIAAAAPKDATFWMPRQASEFAADVDWNWNLVYWISMPFFIGITALLLYYMIRHRAKRGAGYVEGLTHHTALEVTWSVIPTILVLFMFWNGYKTYLDMATPPQNAYEVLVTGQKWNWMFTYPNGHIDGELHVPVDTPVRLVMSSEDVMHSFFVPEFRVKRDLIPGRYDKVWFTAIETGQFDIYCTEYCGTSHSEMLSKVHVQQRADFDAWLEEASDFLSRMPPAEAGELLYGQRGCKQCHSLDGAVNTGPTFLGVFMRDEVLTNGTTVPADENYIRESILNPQEKVVAGYEPVMPTYQGRLKDEEITAIIEFLKTLQ